MAEAMMRADWEASAHDRPPDADLKSYYRMAQAALDAAGFVIVPKEPPEESALVTALGLETDWPNFEDAHRAMVKAGWPSLQDVYRAMVKRWTDDHS